MRDIQELVSSFQGHGERHALVVDGNPVTYNQLVRDICALAHHWDASIAQGDRVLVILRDKYELICCVYSLMYIGAVAVPCDPAISLEEIEVLSGQIAAKKVVKSISRQLEVEDDSHTLKLDSVTCERVGPKDPAMIMFTSGTTGKKKATVLTHSNLMQTAQYINSFMCVTEPLVDYVCIPLHHSFGFGRSRCVWLSGGTIILDNGLFNPRLAVDRMKTFKANAFSGVPSVMAMFIGYARHQLEAIADQVRYVEIGSAPMSVEHKSFLVSTLKEARICMHYGLTEASRSCLIEFREEDHKLSSVGRHSPGVSVQIVDESGCEVPVGHLGQIAIRGPNVAAGYFNDPELTGRVFRSGWFYTGDVGRMDDDGYIYYEGRMDDMINVGGDKVSPGDIERRIQKNIHVGRDFCVVGGPDKQGLYGSVPYLCVVAPTFSLQELESINVSLIRDGLKEVFKLRSYVILDSIPRTGNGKIRRSQVRKMLEEAHGNPDTTGDIRL